MNDIERTRPHLAAEPPDPAPLRAKLRRMGIARPDLADDPLIQFRRWYDEWTALRPLEAAAFVLATMDPEQGPSARVMRLSAIERGLVFFTDGGSRKAVEMSRCPRVAACFQWFELARQVRVRGTVHSLEQVDCERDFGSLPREQQLLAHASDQRRILASRDEIKARLAETAAQFPVEVPWTAAFRGYRLEIDEMELWQGRTDNVHDRFRYQHTDGGGWRIEQLAP